MPGPNCDIALTFYEVPTPRFSYYRTNSSLGWRVQQDGSIHPPSRSRVVRINVEGYPNSVVFAGFQLVSQLDAFPAESEPWYIESSLSQTVTIEPALPPANDPAVLTLTFTGSERLFYRLAVRDANDPTALLHWDDPKIYNNGDE